MDRLSNWLGGAWDFAAAHPLISAWLAATSVWAMFTLMRRDGV